MVKELDQWRKKRRQQKYQSPELKEPPHDTSVHFP
jgi:hypothetical protein